MPVSAEIWVEREEWRGPLALSVAFHGMLLAGILIYTTIVGGWHTEEWGSGGAGGGAMSATLVSSTPVPLPANELGTNIVANESKGLTQSLPQVQETPPPEAIPIPEKPTKQENQPHTTTTAKVTKPVIPSNVVPFGEGGPVSGPYGVFNANGAKGGFSFGGSGDFGSKYGWYVDVVRRKVSENWMKYEIDPSIESARRVYITFDILRNGEPTNVQIEQSSGVPSLDMSAVRALQRIDTFGPLPGDYSGNKVAVEFWFDYRR
jgi:protein TonB